MNGVGRLRKNRLHGSKTGAAVSGLDDEFGVHALLDRPLRPGARNSGRGIHQDPIHIKQQGRAEDTSHWAPGKRNKHCGVKRDGGEGRELFYVDLVPRLSLEWNHEKSSEHTRGEDTVL